MNIREELIHAWHDIEKPRGLVADIENKSQAHQEYKEIQDYFVGRSWDQVDPDAWDIRFMNCCLLWMNQSSAKYYALSYLVYLISPEAEYSEYDTAEYTISYFLDSNSSILPMLSETQQNLAEKIISEHKETRRLKIKI